MRATSKPAEEKPVDVVFVQVGNSQLYFFQDTKVPSYVSKITPKCYPKRIVSFFSQVVFKCKAAHTASAIKGASNMFNEVTDILSWLKKITNYPHFYHSC